MDVLQSSASQPLLRDEMRASFFHRAFEGFLSLWQERGGQQVRRRIFFLTCLAVLCAATVFTGAVPTRRYGHDIFFLLENGWRIVNGQRPHIDFYSPWGPVTYLVVGLGLKLSHNTVNGVGYGTAVFGLLIGLWSYALGRNRMESSPRILASLFLTALVLAPYPLGIPPFTSSHAMVYNRYGYGLLGLVMLECFQPIENRKSGKAGWAGGISSGAAIALALFLKASYFLVAISLLGVSLLFWRRSRQRLLGLAAGFALVTFLILLYLGFDVSAILRDLQMAAASRSKGLQLGNLVWAFLSDSAYLLVIALLVLVNSLEDRTARSQWIDFRMLLLGATTYVADMLVRFTNAQTGTLPLGGIFALIVMNQITARHRDRPSEVTRAAYAGVLSLSALLLLPQLIPDVAGIAYGAMRKARPARLDTVVRFTEPRLAPLLLYDGEPPERSNGTVATTYINEGAALLRRASAPDETILTMDMTNPFPYVLGRKPALGGMAASNYNMMITDAHHPSDDAYFGTADLVMVPKRPANDDRYFVGFYKIYETGLHARYRLAAETDWWLLYRRK